ncbi:hypothetical protein EJ05DRAFT_358705 [Pseudovirgaria hyperparasitica]|uniref:Uncharacterized protein n=1 Tax=Pseudovirgaria hyperparasitica TaxID=470096 RepID=A0A6A6W6W7_9PEZI|nr:uncharacterized protein EJ05DRAFT_358705 [Pseudovirgaria hyperparasitica]KAF2758602.1 hypothetical protein EJ05DRAFT_358705 [Pseudovirgaria hyperparasitica]
MLCFERSCLLVHMYSIFLTDECGHIVWHGETGDKGGTEIPDWAMMCLMSVPHVGIVFFKQPATSKVRKGIAHTPRRIGLVLASNQSTNDRIQTMLGQNIPSLVFFGSWFHGDFVVILSCHGVLRRACSCICLSVYLPSFRRIRTLYLAKRIRLQSKKSSQPSISLPASHRLSSLKSNHPDICKTLVIPVRQSGNVVYERASLAVPGSFRSYERIHQTVEQ